MFIQEELQSISGLFLNLFLSSIGIIALIALWKSIYQTEKEIFGITYEEMIRYYLGVLIIGKLIKSGSDDYFKEKIESGDIITDLTKPINYLLLLLARTIAKIIVYVSGLVIISIVVAFVINISPVRDLYTLLIAILPIVSAFFLGFFITTTMSSLYFYLPELRYFSFLARDLIMGILAGVIFNIELLKGIAYEIFNFLPFKYIINFPVLILSSSISKEGISIGIINQTFWTFIFGALCIYTFNKGLKKYNTFGG
jgi:ABC-2 type transport system permease protein